MLNPRLLILILGIFLLGAVSAISCGDDDDDDDAGLMGWCRVTVQYDSAGFSTGQKVSGCEESNCSCGEQKDVSYSGQGSPTGWDECFCDLTEDDFEEESDSGSSDNDDDGNDDDDVECTIEVLCDYSVTCETYEDAESCLEASQGCESLKYFLQCACDCMVEDNNECIDWTNCAVVCLMTYC